MHLRGIVGKVVLLCFLASCGGSSGNGSEDKIKLDLNTTWYIQLQGSVDTTKNVKLYDVDLFDTSEETIYTLKNQGKIVICYFNAGAYEDWRPDKDKFPQEVIGNPLVGWEGEYWLDIRDSRVRKIIRDRLKLAKEKGCDGVDPDNVNAYLQDTGFDISYNDQLDYNRFLAEEAHNLGLLIGLKNDGEQVKDLVDYFDFSVQEECHQYGECGLYYPFIEAGKPVFNIEYDTTNMEDVCSEAQREKFMTAFYNLELDGSFFKPCWE